jgi:hypothetical protein
MRKQAKATSKGQVTEGVDYRSHRESESDLSHCKMSARRHG